MLDLHSVHGPAPEPIPIRIEPEHCLGERVIVEQISTCNFSHFFLFSPSHATSLSFFSPMNKFSLGGLTSCTACISGHSPEGSTSCTSTNPGSYHDPETGHDPPCPNGRFSAAGAGSLALCNNCTEGKWAGPDENGDGSLFCKTAAAGKIPTSDRGNTTNCPPNTKNSGGVDVCQDCLPNSYSNPGSSFCYVCELGHEYDDTMSHPQKCAQCPVSKFSATGVSCELCVASSGYVQDVAGSASCNYCGLGKFADVSTNKCVDCLASKYSTGGGSSCTDCESGKISASAAQSTCAFCDAGQVPNINGTTCETCTAGKMSNIGGERPEEKRNICTPSNT